MKEKKTRLALLTLALGLWLIAVPLTFGYKGHPVGISDSIAGILLLFFGFMSLAPWRVWSGWAIGLVGVWLQFAPLVFWAPQPIMYLNDTLVGALAIVFAFLLNQKEESLFGSDCPKGWSYNPSGWSHRIPTIALAMLCWFFSRYMGAFELGYIDYVWDPFFPDGTFHVITSRISKDFPVPDAGLGALCYTLEALLGWQGGTRRWYTMPWLVCAFGFLVIPVGMVSITLIILQPVAVGAWCSWCLATAASMLFMIVLTAGELAAVLQFLRVSKQKGASLWTTFWKGGKPDRDLLQQKPRSRPLFGHSLGISLPWNLLVCFAIGIFLMASPYLLAIQGDLATACYILGPLIAAFSIFSLAEAFRTLRLFNILFGALLLLAAAFSNVSILVLGIVVVALSLRKGPITERYGAWEKLIK